MVRSFAASIILGAFLCVAGGHGAEAATPNFDTPSYCRATILQDGGEFTQEKYDYCIRTEHAARGMVGRVAGRASRELMDRCIAVAKTNRDGTPNQGGYGILVTCLEGKQGLDGDGGFGR